MSPFIPNEEEFETILLALESYEKETLTKLVVEKYLAKVGNLTDEQAFTQAFSKTVEKDVTKEVREASSEIRDKIVLLYAKVLQFRNAVRKHRLDGAIEDLLI